MNTLRAESGAIPVARGQHIAMSAAVPAQRLIDFEVHARTFSVAGEPQGFHTANHLCQCSEATISILAHIARSAQPYRHGGINE